MTAALHQELSAALGRLDGNFGGLSAFTVEELKILLAVCDMAEARCRERAQNPAPVLQMVRDARG